MEWNALSGSLGSLVEGSAVVVSADALELGLFS